MAKSTARFFIFVFFCFTTIVVYGQQAAFTANTFSGCKPLNVQFQDLSIGATSWSWDLGNGNPSTLQNPTAQYQTAGTYTVILTINGGSTASHTVTVFENPTASFVSDDDTTCAGGTITFSSTSTQGSGKIVYYQWSFGDGTADSTSGSTVAHIYTLQGTFTTNLVVIDSNGCSSSSPNTNIYVVPAPMAGFNMVPGSSCNFFQSVSFSNTTTPPATTYSWNFGDPGSGLNNISVQTNPSHLFTATGQYQVVLNAKTGTCVTTNTQTFYMEPIVASFNAPDSVCRYSTVSFTNTSAPPATSVHWDFGDPASGVRDTSILFNPIHIYNDTGSFTVTLIANNGCADTVQKVVYVRPQASPYFIANDSNFCQPATVQFQGSGSSTINSWNWAFSTNTIFTGIIGTDTVQNPSFNFGYGVFSVRLIVRDIYGCSDTITKLNYIYVVAPNVTITSPADSGCAGKSFSYTAATSTAPTDVVLKYYWDFGDASGIDSTSGSSPSHIYTSFCGIFDVKVIVKTSKGCTDSASILRYARVGLPAMVKFYPDSDTIVCFRQYPFEFIDLSTPNGCPITARSWNFGGSDSVVQYLYTDTGKYDVQLTVYSNGCRSDSMVSQMVTVLPPVPLFDASFRCDSPLVVTFTNRSHGSDSLIWIWGDGSPNDSMGVTLNDTNKVVHTFLSYGLDTVRLIAFNTQYGCSSDTSLIIRLTKPVAAITPVVPRCRPYNVSFSSSSSQDASQWNWNFGDPASGIFNTSISSNPSHRYDSIGDYTVSLVITDIHGCKDSTSTMVRCLGPTTNFRAIDTAGCRPFTTLFKDSSIAFGSPITSYAWNFNYPLQNDTLTVGTDTLSHTFPINGLYSVRLITIDSLGCRDTSVQVNYISVTYPDPQFLIGDNFVCDDSLIHFKVAANGTGPFIYDWNFGDGSPDSTIMTAYDTVSVDHIFPVNDTLNILKVIVTDRNSCKDTALLAVRVLHPAPSDSIYATQADSCGYTLANFNAGPNNDFITSWLWQPFGPFNYSGGSTLISPTFQFNVAGWYGASVTLTNPGCTIQYTRDSLVLVKGPEAGFTYPPDTSCPPLPVPFTTHLLSATPYKYILWDFGDGSSGITDYPDSTINHIYRSDGTYYPFAQVAYVLPSNGKTCLFTDTNMVGMPIVIKSYLTVAITNTDTACLLIREGRNDTLTSVFVDSLNMPPYTYTWNVFPSNGSLPVHNTTEAIYTAVENDSIIILTFTDRDGCQAYDTVCVRIIPCDSGLTIPNVFTPNGDNKNDTYYINYLCPFADFKIIIFNRWGNIVYRSSDSNFHWDGIDENGKECADGTYYYTIHGKRKNQHGYIQLIREKPKD